MWWLCAYICIHLHASILYFFSCLRVCIGLWLYTHAPLCVPHMCAPVCIHRVLYCTCFSYPHVRFRFSMCVSGAWVVTHSDCELRPLAGEAVGLAGLSRALKQLCSSARLRWWWRARLHVTLKRYSRELLTGRAPAGKQGSVIIVSYCWQPRYSATIGSEPPS